jgi:hypothetical protein
MAICICADEATQAAYADVGLDCFVGVSAV